jgi:3D (Asp-Asp-Asp) domain-containing protein
MRRAFCTALLAALSMAATPTTMRVKATAYCQAGTTKSGARTRTGIVAADPRVLPVGTVLKIMDGPSAGVYTVMDTGAAVKGRKIDIFIPDCRRARRFGAQTLQVRVLRHGWDPKAAPATTTAESRP